MVSEKSARGENRLTRLTEANAVREARAQERAVVEQAKEEEQRAPRAEWERQTGRRPGGRPPPRQPQEHGW